MQGRFVIHARGQLVNLTIAATDYEGQPAKGLKASDVVLEEDDKPLKLLNFSPAVPRAPTIS